MLLTFGCVIDAAEKGTEGAFPQLFEFQSANASNRFKLTRAEME